MKKESESGMFRFLLYFGVLWLGWKLVKTLVRSMSGADPLNRKREPGSVRSDAEKPRVEFKDVQEAEFTEIKDREPASK